MSNDIIRKDGPAGSLRLLLAAGERRNSLRSETVTALSEALKADTRRTVVIESATPRIFCAGADLKIDARERAHVSDQLYELYELMVTRQGVVVAVVDGAAVGGGAQLAAAADIRIISGSAKFRWVGPGHGLAVGPWILPELVGRSAALELTLTSRWVSAEQAVQLGLATAISPNVNEQLETTLTALAAGTAEALSRTKQIALGGLLVRLWNERRSNYQAWDGHAPSPKHSS